MEQEQPTTVTMQQHKWLFRLHVLHHYSSGYLDDEITADIDSAIRSTVYWVPYNPTMSLIHAVKGMRLKPWDAARFAEAVTYGTRTMQARYVVDAESVLEVNIRRELDKAYVQVARTLGVVDKT